MKVIAVIPARFASTRFPGKVLADLNGKVILQHVWEKCQKCRLLDKVLIACDDKKIFDAVKVFGADVVMTSVKHVSGTDRIAEAVRKLNFDIVVNVQADEPLIESKTIDQLAKALINDRSAVMATVIKKTTDKIEIENPNVVKVVIDQKKYAIYFSRHAIPYQRGAEAGDHYKHLGIYAYRKKFLMQFSKLPKSSLEISEKLEQLRVIEAGYKIKTILTNMETIGVDTPEDLAKVKKYLNKN